MHMRMHMRLYMQTEPWCRCWCRDLGRGHVAAHKQGRSVHALVRREMDGPLGEGRCRERMRNGVTHFRKHRPSTDIGARKKNVDVGTRITAEVRKYEAVL